MFSNLSWILLNTKRHHCCVPPAGTFTPKKSPSNVRSVGRASVSPGLWLSTKHYTCRSRNWSQPRSSDSLCQQGRDGDTGKTKPKTTTAKDQPKTFSSQLLEVEPSASMGILFKDEKFHQPVPKEVIPKKALVEKCTLSCPSQTWLRAQWMCGMDIEKKKKKKKSLVGAHCNYIAQKLIIQRHYKRDMNLMQFFFFFFTKSWEWSKPC